MKISPVQGMPTIPNPSATGLSPEKLAMVKAIAANQTPEPKTEPEKETVTLGEPSTSKTQVIKMNTNRNTQESIKTAEPIPEEPKTESVPEIAVSDASVQAKPVPEAIRPVSPELAELAKQKRAFQLEREQFQKEKEASKAPQEGFISLKDLQTNALGVLLKNGITYDQLTNEILGQSGNNEVASLKQEIEALKKGIDDRFTAKDTAQEEAVYGYMRQEVDKMSNLEPYRFIRENKAQDKVMELVKRSWKESGEILSEDEAMNLIEAELREDARRYAKLISEVEPPPKPAEPSPEPKQGGIKTLTNKDLARPIMSRRQRAIAAALGQK